MTEFLQNLQTLVMNFDIYFGGKIHWQSCIITSTKEIIVTILLMALILTNKIFSILVREQALAGRF